VASRSPHHWPPPSAPPGRTTRVRSSTTDATGEEEGLPSAGEGAPPPLFIEDVVGDLPSLWKRRLVTREDPYSIHKISSILYSISALVILGTGAYQHVFESPESFAAVPSYLVLPTYVFAVSNVVMCAVSTRMAFLHRRYDLTARNAFLGTGASSMFSGFYFLWTSPYGPGMFDDHLVSTLCFVVLVGLNVVLIGDTMLKVPGIVESRRDRKAADYPGRFLVDAMGYVLPVAWGLPPLLITFYVAAIAHDRAWFFEQCRYIDATRGAPGMGAELSYLQVATSAAASYGSLFVTLRDKKLISKGQELAGITAFSVPTMVWTIFASAEFIKYLEW
jgi:hypothetical protein